jgi:hypothetical protein
MVVTWLLREISWSLHTAALKWWMLGHVAWVVVGQNETMEIPPSGDFSAEPHLRQQPLQTSQRLVTCRVCISVCRLAFRFY